MCIRDSVSLVAELLTFPMGVFLAWILPVCTLNLGPLGKWCINPDHHLNIKEHTLIVIMANVTIGFAGGADASGIIQAAKASRPQKHSTASSFPLASPYSPSCAARLWASESPDSATHGWLSQRL